MHKTLKTDLVTYVQNILQPSFVGPFDVIVPRRLPTMPKHNPALIKLVTGNIYYVTIIQFNLIRIKKAKT